MNNRYPGKIKEITNNVKKMYYEGFEKSDWLIDYINKPFQSHVTE